MQKVVLLRELVFIVPLLLAVGSAQAEEFSFKVTGTVSSVSGFAPNGAPLVQQGDTITLCYTFESEAQPDPDGSNANLAFYPDALRDATLEAGSLTMTGSTGSITVSNDWNRAGDTYQVFASGLSGSGLPTLSSNILLEDRFRQTALSSTDLPLTPPDLSKFDRARWFFGDRDNRLSASVDAIELCVAEDTTPPEVACRLVTNSLWSPNHKLVDVGLDFDVVDDQDADPSVRVFVYSDEPESAAGSGNFEYDAFLESDSNVIDALWLRAERSGRGDGRVYLIVVTATDASGNVGFDCCTVTVAKGKNRASRDAVEEQAEMAELECLESGAPPAGFFVLIE